MYPSAPIERVIYFLHVFINHLFTLQNVRAGLADANRVLSSGAPEAEKEEARIEVEVFEGLQAALSK